MGHRGPDPLTGAALLVAVVAISSSASLIAYAAAPALAIAFWRNALAVGVLAPFALARRREELRRIAGHGGRREALFCALAGLALAAHFGTWVPSVKLTSVATSTALVATQPVWQALIAVGQGRRPPLLAWAGIALAVTGTALATGVDLTISGRAVAGDLLALLGGAAAAIYTAFGEQVRASVSTMVYTTTCYAVCGVVLLAGCVLAGVRLGGYDRGTWLAILALVVGAQLLGHSLLNYALHRISATTISVMILLEVPGSALLAWAWLGQRLDPRALPGLALLMVGVAAVVLTTARAPTPATLGPGS